MIRESTAPDWGLLQAIETKFNTCLVQETHLKHQGKENLKEN